ncbi:hypothetical protein GCM10009593_12360 [Microlunatus antarcticus]
MAPPGAPFPPGGPPPVRCEDEADDDADGELEVVVSELQALTEMSAATANEAAKLRRRAGVTRRGVMALRSPSTGEAGPGRRRRLP